MAGENFSVEGDLRNIRENIATMAAAGPGAGGATEAKQDTLIGHVDGIEALIGTTNTTLTTIDGRVDGVEALLTTIDGRVDGLESQTGIVTETAPATDTASSGLNGRLQRIAQRLTSLIALLPTALGAGGGLKVDGSGTALPVSGPQTNTEFLAALRSTATHSSVSSVASSTTILASNANRKGARIFNTDANALYLDLSGGTAVAATRAQVKLATDEGYDVPFGLTGLITGIWAADGAGVASVVEFT